MPVEIVRRPQWGARYDDGAGDAPLPALEGVFVHHSTGPARNGAQVIRDLEATGEARFGAGISYTFPITPDGTIYEGHSLDRQGTHTKGYNTPARAIVFVGNYENDLPTEAQIQAAAELVAHGVTARWWAFRVRGHRDVRPTACPGDAAYALIPEIIRRAQEILAGPHQEDPFDTMNDDQQKQLLEDVAAIKRSVTVSASPSSPRGATLLWYGRKAIELLEILVGRK